jgi:TolB-like protein/AraC-like DNA-binding protein
MSGDPENEYFSDGLSEEILNALAQVPGLRVPARTSSFAFKGKTQDVARIAEALHVTTVLEGSVRKVGGRVRITAQLVGASDGYHLWSQSYDRELKDVFAIQDELAAAIAGALKLQLRPTAAGAEKRSGGTSNSEAYEAYLKGRQALNDRTRASIEKALLHFERATALDPSFALAHADAAIATVLLGNGEYGVGLAMPVAIARARSSLEKARAVAPNHPEVLAAAGLIERFDLHPEQSLALFDRSLAINPSSAEVLYWRKGALEDLDRYDEALPAMAAALRADPLSKIVLLNYVGTLESLGRVAEADAAAVRLRGLDESWGQQALGELAAARADHVAVVRHLLPAVQQGRSAVWPLATTLAGLGLVGEGLRVARDEPWDVYWVAGDLRRALEATEGPARQFPDDDLAQNCHFYSLYLARRFTEAAEIAAQIFHDGRGRWLSPGNLLQLAAAAREAGRVEEAGRYRDVAARRLEQSVRTGLTESSLRYTQASLAAYDGRDDEALALVSGPLSAPPFPCNHTDLSLPVYFSRIAGRPEFQAALRRIDAGLAEQRTRVLALLCGPERPSATWQPLPETCAGYTGPR